MKQKAFTLAEIMIVLSVIAILVVILLPVAKNSMPNEKEIKFKKGYETFQNAITELVTSDKYYLNGDLGKRANGDLIDGFHEGDFTYFCESLADVLNTKNVRCNPNHGQTNALIAYSTTQANENKAGGSPNPNCTNIINNNCPKFQLPSKITTKDGITFYEPNSKATYGMPSSPSRKYRMFDFDGIAKRNFTTDTTNYKPFCMDIDDPCKGEPPFEFGLRVDGKIINNYSSN